MDGVNAARLTARIASGVRIPTLEATIMRRFGKTFEEAHAIVQAKRSRAGKLRAAKYVKHRAPKGGRLRDY